MTAEAVCAARIPVQQTFGFARPKRLGAPFDPRSDMDWFLQRGIKVGTLYNPYGASRWGYAHVLVDDIRLAQIRPLAYASKSLTALPFTMDDEMGNAITTDLFMLPAVPLHAFDANFNLYLMPLVDARFYWWQQPSTITVNVGTTTWASLYSQIASALGITLTVDPVASAYTMPSAVFSQTNNYLPLLLDWVAASVGQRIVRTLAGTYYARNATTAISLTTSQISLYKKFAGGKMSV